MGPHEHGQGRMGPLLTREEAGRGVPSPEAVSAAWRRAAQLESRFPHCRSVWWGRRTGLWLALVSGGSGRILVEAATLEELARLVGLQGAAR